MKNHSSQERSQRQLRVGEQIRHLIAETLQRGHFQHEALLDAGQLSVTEVRCSPDLKNATAYMIALGSKNNDIDNVLKALNEESQTFQKDINKGANLKFTPRVRFVKDESFESAQNIEKILGSLDIPKD